MTSQRQSRNRAPRREHNEAAIRRRILPARDATPIKSLLVYARNKVGKTNLAGSASELGKTLIIDTEEGSSSLKKRWPKAEVYKLKEFEEIDEVYWYLANREHGYKFVALDPITRLGQHAMRHVLRARASTDLAADPYQPTQQDWGKTAELMRRVVNDYKALPNIFLIITAYERRRESDDEESIFDYIIGPDAQPAVKGFLMGQMDIIGRLYIHREEDEDGETTQIERRLLTSPTEIYEAGDRSDNLPRILREPTMAKIMTRINRRTE